MPQDSPPAPCAPGDPPPVPCAPPDPPPAVSTSELKEILQSINEMVQVQTNMMHVLLTMMQQQMNPQQVRHEYPLANFVVAQQQQANGENI